MDRVRKLAESCDGLQGFVLFHSFGGGTGSGFGSRVMENLFNHYPSKCNIEFAVYPSPRLSSIVLEPYNAAICAHRMMETTDLVFLVDNEAMYDIAISNLDIPKP